MELTTKIRERSISTRIFCRFIFGSDCSCTETSCNDHAIEAKPSQENKSVTATLQEGYLHVTWNNPQATIKYCYPMLKRLLMSRVCSTSRVLTIQACTRRRRLSCHGCRTSQSYDNCVFATGNLSAWRLLAVCHCWIRCCLLG